MSKQLRQTSWHWARAALGIGAALLLTAFSAVAADKDVPAKCSDSGEEIFRREWLANDPRSRDGDGLGPVFNESSCVACHNQGGVGGAGALEKNVSLVTAFLPTLEQLKAQLAGQPTTQPQPESPAPQQDTSPDPLDAPAREPRPADPASPPASADAAQRQQQIEQQRIEQRQIEQLKRIEQQHVAAQETLFKLHPGFRDSRTVVWHRFGTDAKHEDWRNSLADANVGVNAPAGDVGVGLPSFDSPNSVPGAVMQAPSGLGRARFARGVQSRPSRVRITSAGSAAPSSITEQFPAIKKVGQQIQSLQQQARNDLASARGFGLGGSLQTSQRNTTALFGAGLIDAIPAAAIEAAAAKTHEEFADISGRVHHLKSGRIGRFGWKAQEAALYDFTMTACAVEVGLHVPDHPQSPVPYNADVKPAGYDLDQSEANALVDYLKALPAPVQRKGSHAEVAARLDEGEQLFASVGCAACHVKQMGQVDGLFSDLLLHDMGPDLGSVGSYGVPTPSPADPGDVPLADAEGKPRAVEPTAQEWRTPPLWGVRDSAPYLHDGRAATLEQAIAFHGGEAADARLRFFMQPHARRQKIVAFLKSLTAPSL